MVLLPPVGGGPQRQTVRQAVGAFAAGSALGGLTTASGLLLFAGLLSSIALSARVASLLALVALAAALQTGVGAVRLPSPSHIIPQTTFGDGMVQGMLRFGFELGLGFRTQIPTVSPYVLAGTVLLVGDVVPTVVLGLTWGAGRAAAFYGRAGLVAPEAAGSLREAVLTRYERRMARLSRVSVWVLLGAVAAWCAGVLLAR